jgi:transposase-like protein
MDNSNYQKISDEEKVRIIRYAREHSVKEAAIQYLVSEKTIRNWRKKEEQIEGRVHSEEISGNAANSNQGHPIEYNATNKKKVVAYALANSVQKAHDKYGPARDTIYRWIADQEEEEDQDDGEASRTAEESTSCATLEDLKGLTHRQLFKLLDLPERDFNKMLAQMGLLHQKRICDCGGQMTYHEKDGKKFWRCRSTLPTGRCEARKGFYAGTFFEHGHLSPQEVFQLSYYYSRRAIQQEETRFQMKRSNGTTLSPETIVDYKNYFRGVCAQYFIDNPVVIGGPGCIVEIDESVISSRKYNRGKSVGKPVWIFGGVVRGDPKQCFLVYVEKRDKKTLIPHITTSILAGSTIMSDGWAAYNEIKNIWVVSGEDAGTIAYEHKVVNHSKHFKDPVTGACTNTVEGMWSHWKAPHKAGRGTQRKLLTTYIDQFMWFRRFGGPDALFHLWSQVAASWRTMRINNNIDEVQTNESNYHNVDEDDQDEEPNRSFVQDTGTELYFDGNWQMDDVDNESDGPSNGNDEDDFRGGQAEEFAEAKRRHLPWMG